MSRVFSEFERGIIVALKNEGSTWNQIKVELFTRYNRNISKRGMQKIWAKYLKTGEVKDQPRGGRPHKLSARSERVIKRISRLNNDISTLNITRIFNSSSSIAISKSTVERILQKYGIRAFKAVKKHFLAAKQRQRRMQWASLYQNWDKETWYSVIFSDECIFQCYNHRGRRWIRRTRNERLKLGNIHETMSHGAKVHVWGCFSANGVGLLRKVEGSMNAQMYQETIIHDIDIIGKCLVFPKQQFIFQQDLAPPHRALSTFNFLKKKEVDLLPWPGNSPDANPIENVWGLLKRKLQTIRCTSSEQLWVAVQKIWYELSKDYCKSLVESMPRRLKMIKDMKGHSTKY